MAIAVLESVDSVDLVDKDLVASVVLAVLVASVVTAVYLDIVV